MKHLRNIFRHLPLFLAFLPAYVLLHLEYEYQHLIAYRFVWQDLVWIVAAPILFYPFAYLFLRKRWKAALYTFFLLVSFYYFGPLKNLLYEKWKETFIASYSFLLPLLLVLWIAVYLVIKKKQHATPRFFSFVNLLLLIFISLDLLRLPFSDRSILQTTKAGELDSLADCRNCPKPDIYYLIFDSYTSGKQLLKDFNYSNRSTEDFLRSRGFYVADSSSSNYNLTPFSMASVFNMDYLHDLDWQKDFYLKDYLSGVRDTYHNRVANLLAQQGYRIFNYSIFDFNNHPTKVEPYNMWQYQTLYRLHNMLSKVYDDIGWKLNQLLGIGAVSYGSRKVAADRDQHFYSVYDSVCGFRPAEDRPSFVYAHFLLPHAPFSLDSNGNELPNAFTRMSVQEDKDAYLQQLAYTNKFLKNSVDSILAHAKKNSVIVIQGDHGFRYFNRNKRNEEFYNLSAFYFHDRQYSSLRSDQTNVNTFRIIFNQYFNQQLPLLKDSSYFLQYK